MQRASGASHWCFRYVCVRKRQDYGTKPTDPHWDKNSPRQILNPDHDVGCAHHGNCAALPVHGVSRDPDVLFAPAFQIVADY
jgi:hypothetical protein